MKTRLNKLVQECLIEHKGGEKFFDAIDEKLRSDEVLISMMIDLVFDREEFDYLIVSGHFGEVFKEYTKVYFPLLHEKIILINGGIRNGKKVTSFWKKYVTSNKNFIFIDDSYYLGRTRDKIKEAITNHGGKLLSTYVFYDGSLNKDESVHSFYRYYDHFKAN